MYIHFKTCLDDLYRSVNSTLSQMDEDYLQVYANRVLDEMLGQQSFGMSDTISTATFADIRGLERCTCLETLTTVHVGVADDPIKYMHDTIPDTDLSIYVDCVYWAYDLLCNTEGDITDFDPVFHRPGLVSHLYAFFYQFTNLSRDTIVSELNNLMDMIAMSPLNTDIRWYRFHHVTCNARYTDMCYCRIQRDHALHALTREMCHIHNSLVSDLSIVWDENSEKCMTGWLPREMIEDVVWLTGKHMSDTLLVLTN